MAAKLEFTGMLNAMLIQLEQHSERLTEEQIKNWQKIAHLGFLFVDQCEDNWLEIASGKLKVKRYQKELAEANKKLFDLRTEMARLKRQNADLLETIDKGLRV